MDGIILGLITETIFCKELLAYSNNRYGIPLSEKKLGSAQNE